MNKFKGKFNNKKSFFKSKDGGFNRFDKFKPKSSFKEFITAERAIVADVTIEKKDKRLELFGTIDRIVQTGGPTIFHL